MHVGTHPHHHHLLQVVSSPKHPLGGPLNPSAFGFVPVASPFRKPFIRMARWKGLEYIMILIILANCVTLAMQSNQPGFEESDLGRQLQVANFFFIAAFVLEMFIKVMALGFAFGEHTYLRNGACVHACIRSCACMRGLLILLRGRHLLPPKLIYIHATSSPISLL